jgi:hypothetical protein
MEMESVFEAWPTTLGERTTGLLTEYPYSTSLHFTGNQNKYVELNNSGIFALSVFNLAAEL